MTKRHSLPDKVNLYIVILADKNLPPTAKVIAGWLLFNHHNTLTGICTPSNRTIGKAIGIRPENVSRNIGMLVRAGYLLVRRRFGTSNSYDFEWSIRRAVFWGLPPILLAGGIERSFNGKIYEALGCFGGMLVTLATAVYWERIIPRLWRRSDRQPSLTYLTYRDSELGAAIITAARHSAYGRWSAAQSLVNSGQPIQQRHLLHRMASEVMDKILDGDIQVRGRKPGQLDYEAIPRTYWRSTAFYVVEDPLSLWRVVLCPRGGVEIAPDGTIARAENAPAAARTSQLAEYDSLIVDAHEFEKVFPAEEPLPDKKRREFLRQARKRKLDFGEIQRLS